MSETNPLYSQDLDTYTSVMSAEITFKQQTRCYYDPSFSSLLSLLSRGASFQSGFSLPINLVVHEGSGEAFLSYAAEDCSLENVGHLESFYKLPEIVLVQVQPK